MFVGGSAAGITTQRGERMGSTISHGWCRAHGCLFARFRMNDLFRSASTRRGKAGVRHSNVDYSQRSYRRARD
eukprot:scaffold76296_cov26-Tisochrysis_lutea.AAC.1